MDEIVHFNGRFWLNPADGSPGVEVAHREALAAIAEKRAVFVKGGMPRKAVEDADTG